MQSTAGSRLDEVSNILPQRPESLPRPFVIVGEGYGDVCFVDEILKVHKINNCSVGCHNRETETKEGSKGHLDDYLAGIAFARTRKDSAQLSGLLVIVDADEDPTRQFKMVTDLLEDNGFPKPTKPFVVEAHGNLRVAVFLHPGRDRTGTLEHILLEATFKAKPNLEKCLEDFAKCTGVIPTATENQQAKMRLSSLVGACCTENPWASIALLWHSKGNPVPIESECFKPLADLMKELCA